MLNVLHDASTDAAAIALRTDRVSLEGIQPCIAITEYKGKQMIRTHHFHTASTVLSLPAIVEAAKTTTSWGPTYKFANKDIMSILNGTFAQTAKLGKSITEKLASGASFKPFNPTGNNAADIYPTIGEVGGMGPDATRDLGDKIANAIKQEIKPSKDQEHIPVTTQNLGHMIKDRTAYLNAYTGDVNDKTAMTAYLKADHPDNPFAGALEVSQAAVAGGAHFLVFPCNTFHAWHEVISEALEVPCLHIAEATILSLKKGNENRTDPLKVALLATDGTVKSQLYQKAAVKMEQHLGFKIEWILPDAESQKNDVMHGIYKGIKAGENQIGADGFHRAEQKLLADKDNKPDAIVQACTEIPLGDKHMTAAQRASRGDVRIVDPTQALADHAVEFSIALQKTIAELDEQVMALHNEQASRTALNAA
jgi:aspartate racemase